MYNNKAMVFSNIRKKKLKDNVHGNRKSEINWLKKLLTFSENSHDLEISTKITRKFPKLLELLSGAFYHPRM